jgi:RNA polymerase sigma-70 factor (ECF subfamily)
MGDKSRRRRNGMSERERFEQMDDKALVAAFSAGEEQAFVAIVDRYKTRLMRLAQSVVHNEQDALDILQEALIKAYRGLSSFRGTSAVYTWLYRIVMNQAIDFVRRRPSVSIESTSDMLRELPDSHAMAEPEREALNAELRETIFAAIDELPRKHREVVLLREVECLSYKEIAEVLGCNEGTVMSRLYYARERLRTALEPYLRDGSHG